MMTPLSWRLWSFAFSTTLAALMALTVAIALGVEHPWWAAMTVWLVAQPTRGLLLERSLARLVGSLAGAFVGYRLLVDLGDRPALALTGLVLWITLCTGAGGLLRHFRNYGMVLAGYTAGIIVPFGLMDPSHREAMAAGRVACTLLGVASGTIFTAILTPIGQPEAIATRLRDLLVRVPAWLAKAMSHQGNYGPMHEEQYTLLSAIGALEPQTDDGAAGSWRAHAIARQQRNILAALVGLIASGRSQALDTSVHSPVLREAAAALGEAAAVYQSTANSALLARSLPACANQIAVDAPGLADSLERLAAALNGSSSDHLIDSLPDWRDAGVAATRTALTVLLATALWQLTGWSQGPVLAMTATLFACLFSNSDRAITAVHDVLKGSVIGAVVGVACRVWLLSYAPNVFTQVLMMAPFLVAGAFLMARPSTAKMAIDVNMTMLLVARPGLSFHASNAQIFEQTGAILAGVSIAVLMYHAVLPAARSAKLTALARRIALELESSLPVPHQAHSRYLRVRTQTLRMAVLADYSNASARYLLDQALSALSWMAERVQPSSPTQHTRHWSCAQVAETAHALRQATTALSPSITQGENDE